MKTHLSLVALAALSLLTGCTSFHMERGAQAMRFPSTPFGPDYYAEWDVADQKVSAEGHAKVIFWFFSSGDNKYADVPNDHFRFFSPTLNAINKAKASATYEALKQSNADALLASTYSYSVEDTFFASTIHCVVEGYPATIKKVVIPEEKSVALSKDEQLVRVNINDRIEKPAASASPTPSAKSSNPSGDNILLRLLGY